MKIAIEGCAHGELEKIYEVLQRLEEKQQIKIDLLLCCGDFQATRNENDLCCMAIPKKYQDMCSFYKYYSGEKVAPILTIFVGGNHEASNYLQELPYGGWVAPNIYYMGYAGVINVGGIRIGGLSGIYKGNDYMRGHYEKVPYSNEAVRSVYHIRNLEVFRLKQLSGSIDIFLSHDWPTNICNHGNVNKLLSRKPFFRNDIESGKLGSPPNEELLKILKPKYWFAAHLHCKFAALVTHEDNNSKTKFLALDKCLPKRNYLQIVDIPHDTTKSIDSIEYDLEWLSILFQTNHLLSVKFVNNYMPSSTGNERYNFTPTDEEKMFIMEKFNENLKINDNFEKTATSYNPEEKRENAKQPQEATLNPQTVQFCNLLGVDDPINLICDLHNTNLNSFSEQIDCNSEASNSFSSERTSLILPEPVSDVSDIFIDSFCEENQSSQEENKSSQEENISASEKEEESTESAVNIESSPAIKKFKRRNASIYQNDE